MQSTFLPAVSGAAVMATIDIGTEPEGNITE